MTPEQEIKLLKELLYCTKRSCNNCGKVNCENFQRQRIDCCGLWVSYKDYIAELENKIADIKANCDLAIEGRDIKIMELEKENAVLERRIERAKECMKKLLFIINSDPANYNCKGLVQDAEDFIYNRTCNIRQQGEHCISKTRCIMCDKEDEKVK